MAKIRAKLPLFLLFVGVTSFLLFVFFRKGKVDARLEEVKLRLWHQRIQIREYFRAFKEYPFLKNGEIDFWNVKTNQYIWRNTFWGVKNVASGPMGDEIRKNAWKILDSSSGKFRGPNEEDLEKFLNPISGKFDWLAVGEDGKLYSPEMADSIKIASPPIRVKDIRCPLTASDPPFFEDFTKW
jgi:hypothetical protein